MANMSSYSSRYSIIVSVIYYRNHLKVLVE
nr:MAG TPA: hypothetical protein [Bacteriophage sp.]